MTDLCMDFTDPTEGSVAKNIGTVLLVSLGVTDVSSQRPVTVSYLLLQMADLILLGVDGKLALKMMSYKPKVGCRGSIILGGTDEILRKMPAVSTRTTFGRRGVPGVRVLLPLTFTSSMLTAVCVL